ncbi:MAG: FtsW/RodA/SpoVE family cell cycle protein [Mycoplasmatota bacterium]
MIKKTLQNMDKTLLFFTLFMVILGTFNLVTASSREAVGLDVSLYYYFYRQLIFLGICLIASFFIFAIPTSSYKKFVKYAFIAILSLLLYALLSSNRGAGNWVDFIITFQPSELGKPVIIITLACFFEKYYKKLKKPPKTDDEKRNYLYLIGSAVFISLIFPTVIFLQKDFGTMLIMCGIIFTIFAASPIVFYYKIRMFLLIIVSVVIGFVMIFVLDLPILSEEQLSRFDFFNPCESYESDGYQTCNGYIAINDGGLLGLGIGKSKQKYSYIPEPHTDSVFAIFVEEWGVLMGVIVLIIYLIILKRVLLISGKAKTVRGELIALGVAVYIFLHILINLGGLFGIMPLTGVPLPFLSYGGTFTVSMICMIMIVQKINIESKK